jgi:hypothetical protein
LEDFVKNSVLFLVFGIIVIFGLITGCARGNGSIVTQERAVEGFNGITLDGAGNINVHPGVNYKVTVTTDSNLQDKVLTTVNGNNLHISKKSGSFNATELTIDVYLPELKNVALSGAGNIKVGIGNTSELDFSLSGTGNIDAQNFQVQNATVRHSGAGNISIWATNALNGTLSGFGNILYKGNPTINVNRRGVGNIKPM